jgi:hypothetical protein
MRARCVGSPPELEDELEVDPLVAAPLEPLEAVGSSLRAPHPASRTTRRKHERLRIA